MKRLSSKSIFIYKIIFPTVWFGFLAFFVLAVFFGNLKSKQSDIISFAMPIIVSLIMAAFGYFFMKKLVFDLINEVYDEGDSLLFKNGQKEVRVSLRDIKNVSYSTMVNPPRVTLSVRHKTAFGDELSFSPPGSFIPFKKNRDIVELIDRIDRVRG
jgi:hypothetical protein